jgi:hypothetical protein
MRLANPLGPFRFVLIAVKCPATKVVHERPPNAGTPPRCSSREKAADLISQSPGAVAWDQDGPRPWTQPQDCVRLPRSRRHRHQHPDTRLIHPSPSTTGENARSALLRLYLIEISCEGVDLSPEFIFIPRSGGQFHQCSSLGYLRESVT